MRRLTVDDELARKLREYNFINVQEARNLLGHFHGRTITSTILKARLMCAQEIVRLAERETCVTIWGEIEIGGEG